MKSVTVGEKFMTCVQSAYRAILFPGVESDFPWAHRDFGGTKFDRNILPSNSSLISLNKCMYVILYFNPACTPPHSSAV